MTTGSRSAAVVTLASTQSAVTAYALYFAAAELPTNVTRHAAAEADSRPDSGLGWRVDRPGRSARRLARPSPALDAAQASSDSGRPTTLARRYSPRLFACPSWREEAATPSSSRPTITKLSDQMLGSG